MREPWTDDEKNRLRSAYLNPILTINEMVPLIGRSKDAIHHMARTLGIARGTRELLDGHRINPNVNNEMAFSNLTPEAAYWAGFLMADGCVEHEHHGYRISVELSSVDEDHIDSFRSFVDCGNQVGHRPDGKCGMSRLRFRSSLMAADLMKWGVIPNKTCDGQFPTDIHSELLPHFVRGLVDGDGCIYSRKRYSKVKHTISIAGNEAIINRTAEVLRNIGVNSNNYIHSRNEKTNFCTYILVVGNGDDVLRFVRWLQYDNLDVPALPRKRERALHILHSG